MLRDSVYEAIKGLLMDNDLVPGSRLSIDGLARQLEVSPTPVREAMTRLESDGLVAKLPHARYIVAPLMDRVALDNLRLHAHARGNRLYFRAGIAEEALHEHERVIASIEARDGEQAFAHMQQHLEAPR